MMDLWNRLRHLPEDHLLRVTMSESLALGGAVGINWLSDFSAFLSVSGALLGSGLFTDGVPCELCVPTVMDRFYQWLMHVGVPCLMTLVLAPQSMCDVASISSGLQRRVGQQWTHFRIWAVANGRTILRMSGAQPGCHASVLARFRLSAHGWIGC